MKHRFECLVKYAKKFDASNNTYTYKNIYIPVDNSGYFYLGVFKQHQDIEYYKTTWEKEFGKDNYNKFNTEINNYFEQLKKINKNGLNIEFVNYLKGSISIDKDSLSPTGESIPKQLTFDVKTDQSIESDETLNINFYS